MAEPQVDNVEVVDEEEKLEKQLKSAASWFYFIGALSLINTVIALSGSDWGFVVGLAMTQIMDAIAREVGVVGMIISVVFDITIAATFIVFGIFAAKRYKWAFMVQMGLHYGNGRLRPRYTPYSAGTNLAFVALSLLGTVLYFQRFPGRQQTDTNYDRKKT
ncbi:MAG: hypothetical protein ACYSYT_05960 [Planctomycetota bacterium]|jgi:hypothetical protein